LPPLSAAINSAPTFFGMPRVDLPSFAAYIALRCCWLTGGIILLLLSEGMRTKHCRDWWNRSHSN
jgi:hypothetical protein